MKETKEIYTSRPDRGFLYYSNTVMSVGTLNGSKGGRRKDGIHRDDFIYITENIHIVYVL